MRRVTHGLERVVDDLFETLCNLVAESRRPGSDTEACGESIVKCLAALTVIVGPDEAELDYEIARTRSST